MRLQEGRAGDGPLLQEISRPTFSAVRGHVFVCVCAPTQVIVTKLEGRKQAELMDGQHHGLEAVNDLAC